MPVIPLTTPYSLKASTFEVAADDFTAALSQVQFDPTTSPTTWKSIGGDVIRDQGRAEWTVTLGLAQDLAPTGLLRYLHENEGQSREVTFTPVADEPAILATVVLAPASIGGTADGNTAVATVTLAVVGRPEFVDVV